MEEYTEVFVWGTDANGQLGLGSKACGKVLKSPRLCSFNILIREISCGEEHSALISHSGYVYTMGTNSEGRLGLGTKSIKQSHSPCLVEELVTQKAIKIGCGWGHTVVLTEAGEAFSWGIGEYGALGNGSTDNKWSPFPVNLPRNTGVLVSCGSRHTGILLSRGQKKTLCMFGAGEAGQLGTGKRERELLPITIDLPEDPIQVSCGIFQTGVLSENGHVYMTGGNSYGQLGTGTKRSTCRFEKTEHLSNLNISKICCNNFSAALTDKGHVYVWGTGTFGEYLIPTRMPCSSLLQDISIGTGFGVGIDTNNNVMTWGTNSDGELGVDNGEPKTTPVYVSYLKGKGIKNVSCGGKFCIALGKDILLKKKYEKSKKIVPSISRMKGLNKEINEVNKSYDDLRTAHNKSVDTIRVERVRTEKNIDNTFIKRKIDAEKIVIDKNLLEKENCELLINIEELKLKNLELNEKLLITKEQIATVRATFKNDAKKSEEKWINEIERLKSYLSQEREKCCILEDELQKISDEALDNSSAIKLYQNQVTEYSQEAEEFRQAYSNLQQIHDLALKNYEKEINDLKLGYEKQINENIELQHKLEIIQSEKDTSKKNHEKILQELMSLNNLHQKTLQIHQQVSLNYSSEIEKILNEKVENEKKFLSIQQEKDSLFDNNKKINHELSLLKKNYQKLQEEKNEYMEKTEKEIEKHKKEAIEQKIIIEKISKENSEQTKNIEISVKECTEQVRQFDKMIKENAEQGKMLEKVHNENIECLKIIDQLTKDKNNLTKSLEKSRKEKDEFLRLLEKSAKEKEEYFRGIQNITQDKEKCMVKIEELTQEKEEFSKKFEKIYRQKEEYNKKMSDYKREIDEAVRRLEKCNKEKDDYAKLAESTKRANEETSKFVDKSLKENTELSKDMARKIQENEELGDKIEKFSELFTEQEGRIQALNEELTQKNHKIEGLLQKIIAKKTKINCIQQEKVSQCEIVQKLTIEKESLNFTLESLNKNIDSVTKNYNKIVEENQKNSITRTQEIDKLYKDLSVKQQTIENLQSEKDSAFKNTEKLMQELLVVNKTYENVILENQDYKSKTQNLISEISKLKESSQESSSEHQQSIQKLLNEISSFHNERKDLLQTLEEKSKELSNAEQLLSKTSHENSYLKSSLETLKQEVDKMHKSNLDQHLLVKEANICKNDVQTALEAALQENMMLKLKIGELEGKNRDIFNNLQKDLTQRAKDYKERTINILSVRGSNPGLVCSGNSLENENRSRSPFNRLTPLQNIENRQDIEGNAAAQLLIALEKSPRGRSPQPSVTPTKENVKARIATLMQSRNRLGPDLYKFDE
ncbi:hypothetical protein SteCoe_6997 [Stentor coeruleus]|uniref:RCC1-like domain-containing protein n=1 Tax=Stentor coeruleus TaxID=5963 RepID=A0A1R2CNJ9_9CILI|nr:hypothetical protein SteCoe_6997 [Stentor coeruleus]